MNITPLVLIAHGSKNSDWVAPFHKMTFDLRQDMGDRAVYLCFMEISEPGLMGVARQIVENGDRKCRLLPMFMAKGNHFYDDIPAQIKEVQAAFPALEIELLQPVGQHPLFLDLLRSLVKSTHVS